MEAVPETFAIWNAICDLEEVFITVGSYVILVPDFFCDLEYDLRFEMRFAIWKNFSSSVETYVISVPSILRFGIRFAI